MTSEQMMSLEKAALQRLTEDRIQSGSMGPEVEEMLAASGIFWDEVENEYFNIEAFQIETMQRLAEEYVSLENA
tara:strand:+ start:543 stop:764 length:222 start_codon:yes stop_codon:yes gene_type:complete